ncbi:MAG: nucleoside triphosphate pyrophosphohydrolase [Hyphomicrobium sp.]|nr:nucleoside triphosphate pyrophosphohydrolase [Hyphomicrobium sp.]
MTPSKDIQRLIDIMAALRTPKTGCPWDLEQTFATIAPYTIEEAYEVADAIQRGDLGDLKDELGDLLLQVVYHSRMAEEQGAFQFGDVVEGVSAKMIRRHPHVFGDETANSAGDVNGLWDRIKAEERAGKSSGETKSLLADIPATLPALTRAIKLQHKAAKVGFDWPDIAPVFEKLKEEIAEFEEVALYIAPSDTRSASRPEGAKPAASGRRDEGVSDAANKIDAMKEEFGDMLFVMANIARHLQIDPEDCLRAANAKFTRRFAYIEQRLSEKGSSPAQSNLAEMDALWDEVRAIDKHSTT